MALKLKTLAGLVNAALHIKTAGGIVPVNLHAKTAAGIELLSGASIDPARYMLASHTIAPNFRLNTADPATTPAQRYHVSALSFVHSPWPASHYRFYFQNSYTNNSGATPAELDPPGPLTQRCAVFDGNSKLLDVTFGGEAEITLAAGAGIWSDPIDVSLLPAEPASWFFARTYSAIQDGGRRPGRRQTTDNAAGFSSTALRCESDQSAALAYLSAGAITSNSGYPNSYAYGPVCMAADNWDGRSCVLVVGDSIAAGNDNAIGKSWITDALYSATNGQMSYYNMAIHGTKPSNQTGDSVYGKKAAIIDSLTTINGGALPMTHIVSEMGVNDASGTNVASLQTKVQDWLNYIAGKWAAPIIQTTYTPRNTNDTANIQTDAAAMTAATQSAANADRWGVAEWIKTNPAPLAGHIDVREAWTGSPTGTTWRLLPWSATLTAAAGVGATSIQVDTAPPAGIVPVLTPGSSSTVECTGIPITGVTGTGPYTVTLGKTLTKAHSIGATVKATMAADGLHPEEGYASQLAQAVVEAAKPTLLS